MKLVLTKNYIKIPIEKLKTEFLSSLNKEELELYRYIYEDNLNYAEAGSAECVKIMNNNGMDILKESKRQNSYIFYKDNSTVYSIHLQNYSFDDAVNIAGSIE